MSTQSISVGNNMDSDIDIGRPSFHLNYEDDGRDEGDADVEFHEEENQIGSTLVQKKTRGGNRRVPSIVWQHMTKFEKTLEDGTFYPYAKCNTCSREFPADAQKNGTSSLKAHLTRCVGSPLYAESAGTQTMLTQESFGGSIVVHKFDQKAMDLKLISWIICAEMPFLTIEHPRFKEMFAEAQPKYKVPCRKTVAKGILELYFNEKEKMKRQLRGVRVSITTDTWTSVQNINYMVVTAHFVDAQWSLHKRIISFKKITSHKGDDLGRVLDACLMEWGIEKLFSITLDNASANDALVEYMKRRLKGRGTLLVGGLYLHVRCACHIINLIVRDGIKELGSAVEGIRNCVKFIHSSPARLDMFRGFTINDPMAKIGMDVVTRWNSTYLMLKSASKYEQVFAKMADDCEAFKAYFKEGMWKEVSVGEKVYTTREGPPTPEDWKKAASLSQFLAKFFDATNTLSGTKYPTAPMILETVLGLQVDINKAMNDDTSDEILSSVAETMSRKFDKYWGQVDQVCPIMFVAQVLDPRVKFEMLDLILPDLDASDEKVKETKALVKDHLTRLYTAYKSESTDQGRSPMESGTTSDHSWVDSSSETSGGSSNYRQKMGLLRKASKIVEVKNEVDSYFVDPCECQNNPHFDLLGWWKNSSTRYPILSMVVKDVLAIPSSSVASESAFSLGGRVVDPFRASLTPKTVEALVCSSDWLRSEEMQFYKEPTEDMVAILTELEIIEKDVEGNAHVALEVEAAHEKVNAPSPSGLPSPVLPSPTLSSLPPRGGRPPIPPRGSRLSRGGGRIKKAKLT